MKQFILSLLLISVALTDMAQNPIIKGQYTADPTARLFGDSIYLFPSHDVINPLQPERRWFAMPDYHMFSSSDLVDWTDQGVALSQENVEWGNPKGYAMWAPDCVEKNGTYYLYFPDAPKDGRGFKIGVATCKDLSEHKFVPLPNPIEGIMGIDPCVLQASDGNNYIFWSGNGLMVAKLKDNMVELDGEPKKIDTLPAGFVEGPFAFEKDGIYYLTYPWVRHDGGTECLAYATSEAPMGPYTYKGVIMQESKTRCWTNHHSIVAYKGQWYLFYHHNDYSPSFDKNRSVCIDSLFFNADGTIKEVEPTLRGVGITDACKPIQIDRYSRIGGGAYIQYIDTMDYFKGWKTVLPENGWISYSRVNTHSNTVRYVCIMFNSNAPSCIKLQFGRSYSSVINLPSTSGMWRKKNIQVKPMPSGIYDLCISNLSNTTIEIDWLTLSDKPYD